MFELWVKNQEENKYEKDEKETNYTEIMQIDDKNVKPQPVEPCNELPWPNFHLHHYPIA